MNKLEAVIVTTKIASFTNDDDRVESYVVRGDKGFHVIFKDLDANEILPTVHIFQTESGAIEQARINANL